MPLAHLLCLWHTCVSSCWPPEPSLPAFFQDSGVILVPYWPSPSASTEKSTQSSPQCWTSIASSLMSSVSSFFPTPVRVHLIGWGTTWEKLWGYAVYIWDRLILAALVSATSLRVKKQLFHPPQGGAMKACRVASKAIVKEAFLKRKVKVLSTNLVTSLQSWFLVQEGRVNQDARG